MQHLFLRHQTSYVFTHSGGIQRACSHRGIIAQKRRDAGMKHAVPRKARQLRVIGTGAHCMIWRRAGEVFCALACHFASPSSVTGLLFLSAYVIWAHSTIPSPAFVHSSLVYRLERDKIELTGQEN